MKKLLLATILGLAISFPLVSNAGQNVFGVDIAKKSQSINHNVLSGHIASDSSNTLVPQKLNNANVLGGHVASGSDDTLVPQKLHEMI